MRSICNETYEAPDQYYKRYTSKTNIFWHLKRQPQKHDCKSITTPCYLEELPYVSICQRLLLRLHHSLVPPEHDQLVAVSQCEPKISQIKVNDHDSAYDYNTIHMIIIIVIVVTPLFLMFSF